MFQRDSKHYEVVRSSLAGQRGIDEQTYASIAILRERIIWLRKRNKVFADVAFSPALQQLAVRENKIAVG